MYGLFEFDHLRYYVFLLEFPETGDRYMFEGIDQINKNEYNNGLECFEKAA